MAETASLHDVLVQYLGKLGAEDRRRAQEELARFIRWCGRERGCPDLQPVEVERYAQSVVSSASPLAAERLEQVRAFLSFLHRKSYTGQNLASHVRLRRAKTSARSSSTNANQNAGAAQLTAEGYARMKEELESLKAQRSSIAHEIQRAAADKDVRENAPLEAARERQGMVEARIRTLETYLNGATMLEDSAGDASPGGGAGSARVVKLGTKVVLRETGTGKETTYQVVSPSESSPLDGKLSTASPVGKALLDRKEGDEIKVSVPRGSITYIIAAIL